MKWLREFITDSRLCGFWWTVWCRTGMYGRFMRFSHRRNWHHVKTLGPFDDGAMMRRCDWCGLTEVIPARQPINRVIP